MTNPNDPIESDEPEIELDLPHSGPMPSPYQDSWYPRSRSDAPADTPTSATSSDDEPQFKFAPPDEEEHPHGGAGGYAY